MRRVFALLVVPWLLGACTSDINGDASDQGTTEADEQVCDAAIDVASQCLGEDIYRFEECSDQMREDADNLLANGCAALDSDDLADSFGCKLNQRIRGMCVDRDAFQRESTIASVADVCPANRTDELCGYLRAAATRNPTDASDPYSRARDVVAKRLQTEPRATVLADTAVRYYIRERVVSLLAWNVITKLGQSGGGAPADYASHVDDVLAQNFPGYTQGSFPMARVFVPPKSTAAACSRVSEAVVLFPDVIRVSGHKDFASQIQAMQTAMPCLATAVVDSGSFGDTTSNAQRARQAIDALDRQYGPLPLHLLGYGQGAATALRVMTDAPDIARRVKSVFTMNSAAHGSELADALAKATTSGPEDTCKSWPWGTQWLCREFFGNPTNWLLNEVPRSMGVPVDQPEQFVQTEDGVAGATDLTEYFKRHAPGVKSMATDSAKQFWTQKASTLPQDTLYVSFRSAITDIDNNLPAVSSNMFHLLKTAVAQEPTNDMQVRLANQSLGGSIATSEIMLPVAEGNHWQWAINAGALPEAVMPRAMVDRIPQRELMLSYYQTLRDIDLTEKSAAPKAPNYTRGIRPYKRAVQ
jgi:hypothetical protein